MLVIACIITRPLYETNFLEHSMPDSIPSLYHMNGLEKKNIEVYTRLSTISKLARNRNFLKEMRIELELGLEFGQMVHIILL